MSRFKLVAKRFSEIEGERQWTYLCLFDFTFKRKTIAYVTITDHYKMAHATIMNNQLILGIVNFELNGRKRLKSVKKTVKRDIYVREWIYFRGKKYRLIFWFKDNTPNHLWIRNCYRVD